MADATVLISLYRSTSGESWQKKKKWLSSEPVCSWYGVECGSNDGIISLRLNENHLGPGTVPTELGDLTAMSTYFRLDGNSLSGTIPSELGRLSLMTSVFYLWGNRFTGELPSELGSLTGLTSNFAVSSNQLSGTLPSQLGRLSKLTIELRLQANQVGITFITIQHLLLRITIILSLWYELYFWASFLALSHQNLACYQGLKLFLT